VYSTTPGDWAPDASAQLQDQIAAWPKTPFTEHPDGFGTIETYTVRNDGNRRTGVIFGRLESDNSRFLATTLDDDDELLTLLTEADPIGARISVRSFDYGNRAALA
jgi:acetyl-CoA C-acetyltransferase